MSFCLCSFFFSSPSLSFILWHDLLWNAYLVCVSLCGVCGVYLCLAQYLFAPFPLGTPLSLSSLPPSLLISDSCSWSRSPSLISARSKTALRRKHRVLRTAPFLCPPIRSEEFCLLRDDWLNDEEKEKKEERKNENAKKKRRRGKRRRKGRK